MAYDVVRPLIHEVLTMVNNAKVKNNKQIYQQKNQPSP